MDRGPSLEVSDGQELSTSRSEFSIQYEICHNLPTVDLLVSLAYSAAAGGVLEDPLPVNLGLRVKPPKTGSTPRIGEDGLCDFDALDTIGVGMICLLLRTITYICIEQKRTAIAELIDSLPSVSCLARLADPRYSCVCRFRR